MINTFSNLNGNSKNRDETDCMEDKSDEGDEYEEGVGIDTEFQGIDGVDETNIVVTVQNPMDIATEFVEAVRMEESVEVDVAITENLAIDDNVSPLSQACMIPVLTRLCSEVFQHHKKKSNVQKFWILWRSRHQPMWKQVEHTVVVCRLLDAPRENEPQCIKTNLTR